MYQRCILHVVVDPRSAVVLPAEAVVRFLASLVLRGPQRRTEAALQMQDRARDCQLVTMDSTRDPASDRRAGPRSSTLLSRRSVSHRGVQNRPFRRVGQERFFAA